MGSTKARWDHTTPEQRREHMLPAQAGLEKHRARAKIALDILDTLEVSGRVQLRDDGWWLAVGNDPITVWKKVSA